MTPAFKSNQREGVAVEMPDTEQDINIDDMSDNGNMEVCLVCLFISLFISFFFNVGVFLYVGNCVIW